MKYFSMPLGHFINSFINRVRIKWRYRDRAFRIYYSSFSVNWVKMNLRLLVDLRKNSVSGNVKICCLAWNDKT